MKTSSESKKWGGARPGAGRKPKLQHEAREVFYSAVDERWGLILEKLDKLIAKGEPSTLRWIVDQRIGRAAQSVDVTTLGKRVATEQSSSPSRIQFIADRVAEELKAEKCGL